MTQKGFSAVEGLLLVVIAGLIGFVGWYVYHVKNQTSTTYDNSAKTPSNQNIITSTQKDGEWIIVTDTKIKLTQWGLSITLPTKLVSKAVYKYDPANEDYNFSLRSIIDDAKCKAYFAPVTMPGIGLSKYPGVSNAHGQVGSLANDTESLSDYYSQHKSAEGNYFTDTNTTRNYYKIGDNFYVLFSDPPAYQQQHLTDFKTACTSVDPSWEQDFVKSMSTLST